MTSSLAAYAITSRLEPRAGRQAELIALLRRLSERIHAEPGCLHYSVHREPGVEGGALTVVQAYDTVEAFHEHAAWMTSHVPALADLLAVAPDPPVLLEQVLLTGDPGESFAHGS